MFTEEQLQEFIKCKNDPVYFINTYVKFNHFKDGLIGFKLYEPQEKLINKYHKNQFNILKAPRQVAGKSSTAIYYILHYIIFEDHKTVGLFSYGINPATHLLDRLKFAYENLPKWMKHGIVVNNRQTLELENGCKVIAASISPFYIKGQTFNLVLLDELGSSTYIKSEEFFKTLFPTIDASKAKFIITSTKDYYENSYFTKIWKDSENGKNDYVRTTIKWNEIPGIDEKFKEDMIANIGIDAWNSEFECLEL